MKLSTITRSAYRFLTGRDRRPSRTRGLVVDRVDDPSGSARLVRVIGAMDAQSVSRVFEAWSDITTPHLVHLDLHDAAILGDDAMLALERAVDHLERQQIGIRIVGIDPYHPALTP